MTVATKQLAGGSWPLGLLNPNTPPRADTSSASELNSLVSGGVVLCAPVISNVQGDSQGLGFPTLVGSLKLGSAAFAGNPAVYGWILCARDGTNYETYISGTSASVPPVARTPDFVWAVPPATQAAIVDAIAARGAPIVAKTQLLLWNQTGVSLAASGNSINYYWYLP